MKCKAACILLFLLCCFFLFACGSEKAQEQNTEEIQTPVDNPQTAERVVPVEAMVLKYQTIQENIPLTGVLHPVQSVDLVAEVGGKITKIQKELGKYVTASDTLAFIDDEVPLSNYKRAKSQVLSAENNLKISRLNLKSDKDLFENGDISELAYETSLLDVKTAEANHLSALASLSLMEKNYNDTRIMSPISGHISRKYIELGTMVNPNMSVYRVVDLSSLKIELGIPQTLISKVTVGSRANVTISALGDQQFEGVVRFVSPQAEENTGAFTTEIHVKNSSKMNIRAGMTAKIDLTLTESVNQLAIPDYALVNKEDGIYVYKIQSEIAKLTPVSILGTFGSQVFIEQGVAEGDTIVVVGMKSLGIDTKVFLEDVH
jgi:RND family efflux transporter MFP subunit